MLEAETYHTDFILCSHKHTIMIVYLWIKADLSDSVNSAVVSKDSVISHGGLLEGELGVKDILQIF